MQYSGWLGDAAAASVMRAAKEKKNYTRGIRMRVQKIWFLQG